MLGKLHLVASTHSCISSECEAIQDALTLVAISATQETTCIGMRDES